MPQPPPPPPPPCSGPAPTRWRDRPRPAEPRAAELPQRPRVPADIERGLCWESAAAVSRSSEGSAGVFFVDFADGASAVVKGCSDVAEQAFAALVGLRVAGVRLPRTRVVDYTHPSDEWIRIKAALFPLAERTPGLQAKVEKELNRAFYLVMELARGRPVDTLGSADAEALLGQPRELQLRSPEESAASAQARARLRQLGRLMAFDALVNNSDRLPLVWSNAGNPHNVFVDPVHGVTAIDNTRDEYMAALAEAMAQMTALPVREYSGAVRVREMLRGACGYDVGASGAVQMQLGFLEGARHIAQQLAASPAVLDDLKQQVRGMIQADWESVWERSMAVIDTSFMGEVAAVFARFDGASAAALDQATHFVAYNGSLGAFAHRTIKVLVMQCGPKPGASGVEFLERALSREERAPDIVVFPELWLACASTEASLANPAVRAFAGVAQRHGCYVLLGSMEEFDRQTGRLHNTAVLLAPDCSVCATYRKRRPVGLRHAPGTGPVAVRTPFGTVSIAICFDVENSDVLDDVLALDPVLVLNPVAIPQRCSGHAAWAVAVDSMRRRFEALAGQRLFTLVRCDHPAEDGGCGSSQAIGPHATTLAPTPSECCFCTYVDAAPEGLLQALRPPARLRTAPEDNTGTRYCVRRLDLAGAAVRSALVLGPCVVVATDDCVLAWRPRTGERAWASAVCSPPVAMQRVSGGTRLRVVFADASERIYDAGGPVQEAGAEMRARAESTDPAGALCCSAVGGTVELRDGAGRTVHTVALCDGGISSADAWGDTVAAVGAREPPTVYALCLTQNMVPVPWQGLFQAAQ
eukprot:m51a1_g7152 putative actinfragmin kinase (811) ;mRNA; r:336152-339089